KSLHGTPQGSFRRFRRLPGADVKRHATGIRSLQIGSKNGARNILPNASMLCVFDDADDLGIDGNLPPAVAVVVADGFLRLSKIMAGGAVRPHHDLLRWRARPRPGVLHR